MNTRKPLYYCACRKPIPETKFDDRGEKVVYCKRCWDPTDEQIKTTEEKTQ